MNPIIA